MMYEEFNKDWRKLMTILYITQDSTLR